MLEAFLHNRPTPKRLVLSLLSAPSLQEISARQCARWGVLFDIDQTAMRVALGRMTKAGFLKSPRRGIYEIGPRGILLSETARSWIRAEQRVGDWDGRWLLVHTAHLGRSDKTALRSRERALHLEGLAPLSSGLWCRPANYREPMAATQDRLCTLGLEAGALWFRADELLGLAADALELWPRAALEERYGALTTAMEESMARIGTFSDPEVARETFLIGEAVIRQINADPLLPDSMINGDARRTMHETMVAYDALGRGAWERFQRYDEPRTLARG